MTLSTDFIIDHPVDPKSIFDLCNTLIGAVDPRQEHRLAGSSPHIPNYPLNHEYANLPDQGFDAWLTVSYGVDGPLLMETFWDDDGDNERIVPHDPPGLVKINFDTAYGFTDDRGRGCGNLHADYIASLGRLCEANNWPYHWRNEFTGEWFDDWRTANTLIHSSDQAQAWTRDVMKLLGAEQP